MEVKGKVHCFFEQSGTFKRAFAEFGIPAEDYDIQNNFGETDHQIDLFAEIERAYEGGASMFDGIGREDLIIAFFPCIEFSCVAQMWFNSAQKDYRGWDTRRMIDYMLAKNQKRADMFSLLYKFIGACLVRGVRMVFENPWGLNTYLKTTVFFQPPSIIDNNRSMRGDNRIKPTAFWFFNCTPTHRITFQKPRGEVKRHDELKQAPLDGICSEERSMISPDYARNFIADFILGKPAPSGVPQQGDLFETTEAQQEAK